MPLAKRSGALVVLLAAVTAIGPLATDLYLPSLPHLTRIFATDPASVQWTLSGFTLGLGAGNLVWGPLADRFGRRPVILVGAVIVALTSLACAASPTIGAMIAARVLQGFCGAALPVVARAAVRDMYEGAEAARAIATMSTIMGLTPVIAPFLGGVLLAAFGWESSFLVIAGYALLLLVAVQIALPETIAQRQHIASPRALLAAYGQVVRNRAFRAYAAMGALCFAGLFAFISGSSFVLQGAFGLGPVGFGICFGIMVTGYITGTLLARHFSRRFGIDGTVRRAGLALAVGGGLGAGLALAGVHSLAAVLVPQVIYALGVGLMLPQASAGAMVPFPHLAGTASALLGFLQLGAGAISGLVAAHLFDGTSAPMMIYIGAMGLCASAAVFLSERGRQEAGLADAAARAGR